MKGGFLLAICFLLSACSSAGKIPLTHSEPITLEVTTEYIDLLGLHVEVSVTPLQDLQPKELAIILRGYKDGALAGEDVVPLAKLFDETLKRGVNYKVPLTILTASLSEYQVIAEWGEDSREILNKREGDSAKADVTIENLQVVAEPERCPTLPCEHLYMLMGNFRNNTDEVINSLEVVVSVKWAANTGTLATEGLQKVDVETISLNELSISSKGTREFRIILDKPLLELDSGRFIPYIRVK